MFNREASNKIGQSENLNIEFGYAYRYTNFTINIFFIRLMQPLGTSKESENNKEHEVRIYRFWSYDPLNDVPNESAYFLKMLQIINFNNPVYSLSASKFTAFARKNEPYPKDSFDRIANYIIHSE